MRSSIRTHLLASLALGFAAAAPAHAQFDLLRRMLPPVGPAGEVQGGQRRVEALAAITRQAGSGRLPEALLLAESQVEQDRLAAAQSPRSPAAGLLVQSATMAAQLHERAGNDARALALYREALAAGRAMTGGAVGRQWNQYARVARLQSRTGDFAGAIATWQAMLDAPDSATPFLRALRFQAHAGLGRAALEAGDTGLAEANLLRAIAEDPAIAGAGTGGAAGARGGGAPGAHGYLEAQATLGAAFGRVEEMLAGMAGERAIMHANGELGAVGREPAAGQGGVLAVEGPLTDLARLYHGRRDAAALRRLYQGSFGDYAARTARVDTGGVGPSALLERQYARFGAYLAGVDEAGLAHEAFAHALRLNAARLAAAATQLPPELLAGSFAMRRQILDLVVSLRLAQGDDAQRWRGTLGDLLQSKGLQSDFMARRARAIGLSADPEVRSLAAAMEKVDLSGGAAHLAQRGQLAQALQARIARSLPPLAFEDGARFLAQVEQRLGGETLVSISAYTRFDFASQRFGARHYLGARAGGGQVRVADLGTTAALDSLAGRLRADLAHPPGKGAATAVPASARAVHDALLKPLFGARGVRGSHVADLDGGVALLPLEALADGRGRYLIDDSEWRYVSSARTLLQDGAAPAHSGKSVVLADPAYDLQDAAAAAGAPGRGAVSGGRRFARLPQAAGEGGAVAAALRRTNGEVTLHTGAAASVEALMGLHSPRYLHVVTHGFFDEEAGALREEVDGNDGQRYIVDSNVSGRSSGLALAGANRDATGILYATQLRQADLAGTELAVLSACDTSVGAVRAGEGVDSLRQALEIAGARSMVTSLWAVPDLETRTMMSDFYDALAAGAAKPAALRSAKLRIRQRQAHPFYWAAFVVTGAR